MATLNLPASVAGIWKPPTVSGAVVGGASVGFGASVAGTAVGVAAGAPQAATNIAITVSRLANRHNLFVFISNSSCGEHTRQTIETLVKLCQGSPIIITSRNV
jgi:hypothetical protein